MQGEGSRNVNSSTPESYKLQAAAGGSDASDSGSNPCSYLCNAMISLCVIGSIAIIAVLSVAMVSRKRLNHQIRKTEAELASKRAGRLAEKRSLEKRLKLVEERMRKPNAAMIKMARGGNAMNVVQVKQWAARCDENADKGNLEPDMAAVEERANAMETELGAKNLLETVPDARFKGIKIRRDTQVLMERPGSTYRSTISLLHDFYGCRMFLSQAPMRNRMGEHWSIMMQEKVGVIVWVGPLLHTNGQQRIFPYIALGANQSVNFHGFVARTLDVALNKNGCNTYLIEVTSYSGGLMKRRMTLVHLNLWPEYNSSAKPLELAKAISNVAIWQATHASYGHPAMLIHCSNGIQESVSVAVCLIGRQMLAHCGTVDPKGIMEYVRGRRYLALSTGYLTLQQVSSQVAVIASVLEVIAILLGKEEGGVLKRAWSSFRTPAPTVKQSDKKKQWFQEKSVSHSSPISSLIQRSL